MDKPSLKQYMQAIEQLYQDRTKEYKICAPAMVRELITSKLLSAQAGQTIIEGAVSGKQLFCDAQKYIFTTYLCEGQTLGLFSAKSALETYKDFVTTMYDMMERREICDAEDLLLMCCMECPFENLDLIAEKFYQWLATLPNEELVAARFSREEIFEGRQYFLRLWEKMRPVAQI